MIRTLPLIAALALGLTACSAEKSPHSVSATEPSFAPLKEPLGQIVAMRRLTEAQYRNSIADIFGPDIRVAGRFEPIVRPVHELIATGAASSTISPAGLEQFDAMARAIAAQIFDADHRAQFMPCTPRDAAAPDPDCAARVLLPVGRALFRRAMTQEEIAAYVMMAGQATQSSASFHKGLELALAAMLVSPHFLYVVESAEADPDSPSDMRLDNLARASRLSFLLWNTTPNEMLLKAAEQGQLTDPAQLAAIAQLMVRSPRLKMASALSSPTCCCSRNSMKWPRTRSSIPVSIPMSLRPYRNRCCG